MANPGKAKVLTEEEFKRVLKITEAGLNAKRNTTLLYFSFGLGLRAKELASLTISHVLEPNGKLVELINLERRMTKGNKQRHIYLTNPKVRRALEAYLVERQPPVGLQFKPGEALFRSQKGGSFSPNSMQQLLYSLYKAAGIPGASSHSGRRTFATRLIEKGVDIKAVSNLMGHSGIAITAQYVEDNPMRLKKIAEDVL